MSKQLILVSKYRFECLKLHCFIVCSSYKPILDSALSLANAPDVPIVMFKRPEKIAREHSNPRMEKKDLDWSEELAKGGHHDCVDVDANDPLYMLYTSGTTGELNIPSTTTRSTFLLLLSHHIFLSFFIFPFFNTISFCCWYRNTPTVLPSLFL